MNARSHDRGRAPRLEPLEARDLPAALAAPHALMTPSRLAGAFVPPAQVGITNVPQGPTGTATAPAANAAGGLPTAHEVARQRYTARFKGNYVIGPGRYTDQAEALSSLGYGGSSQSLHLQSNMRITVPTDPKADLTGQLYMAPWNIGTTGTQLILDLKGDRSTAFNGVPTHYTWTVSPSSAGLYTGAEGSGTMDITFFRPRPGPQRGMLQGQLQFAVDGFVNVVGIFNDLGVLGDLPNGNRSGRPGAAPR